MCVRWGIFDVINIGDESGNFTELNKTANNTYSVDGISFKCPDNWSVGILKEDGMTTIAACQSSNSSFQPQFTVDITPNKGMSEQEAINKVKNNIPNVYEKVSSNITTIDGNKAYKSIFKANDPVTGQSKQEYIYFVKNWKTYVITFSAVDKDFD